MNENTPDLVEQLHRAAAQHRWAEENHRRGPVESLDPADGPSVHFAELPEAKPDSPLYREWNTYCREVGRLLAEGNEGRHVLIKLEQIIGLWDTHGAAVTAGYQRFPGEAFFVHQVQQRERILRCVTTHQWHNLPFPSRQAS